MDTTAEVERLAASTYVSLTTFKRSGAAVATPVWVSSDGDRLYVWTQGDSGKVKRIRNDGHVLVAPSDSRGVLQGAAVSGTASVLDAPDDLARVSSLHRAKYGAQFWLFDLGAKLLRRNRPLVAVEITLD
ncbi:MAG TPA: PPOX class F420-dependent oxidoreductase [Candidatus Nanopelagicales bacterium]|nr:PPOX class F420-dependent oxidoreductase [Candidatus Nanopelagicales bacterium]